MIQPNDTTAILLASKSERAMAAARVRDIAPETLIQISSNRNKNAAHTYRCSLAYLDWALYLIKHAADEVVKAVDAGVISVAQGRKLCTVCPDKSEQAETVSLGTAAVDDKIKTTPRPEREKSAAEIVGEQKRLATWDEKRRNLEKRSRERLECWNCGRVHYNQEHGGFCCADCVKDDQLGWPQCCHCHRRYPRKDTVSQRYCGDHCYQESKITICPVCKKTFVRRNARKQTCCSQPCSNRMRSLFRPCEHPGGSMEKVEAMRLRVELGLPVFHALDSPECIEQHEEVDEGRVARRTGRKVIMSTAVRRRIIAVAMAEPGKTYSEIAERFTGITGRQVQYVLRDVDRPKPEAKPVRAPGPGWRDLMSQDWARSREAELVPSA